MPVASSNASTSLVGIRNLAWSRPVMILNDKTPLLMLYEMVSSALTLLFIVHPVLVVTESWLFISTSLVFAISQSSRNLSTFLPLTDRNS